MTYDPKKVQRMGVDNPFSGILLFLTVPVGALLWTLLGYILYNLLWGPVSGC